MSRIYVRGGLVMIKKMIASIIAFAMTTTSVSFNAYSTDVSETDIRSNVDLSENLSTEDEFYASSGEVEHAYDPIAELEAQQEYRDSVDFIENTIIFSVKTPLSGDVCYLDDSSEVCKKYNLHSIEIIYENKKNGCYEVFYKSATSEDVWETVDKLNTEDDISNAEPDYIWDKTDVGGYEVSSEEFAKSTHYPCLDVEGVWSWLWNNNNHKAPGLGAVVAVIDTGVDYTHIDLKDSMWKNTGEIPDNGMDDDGNGYVDDIYGYDFVEKDGNPMDDHGHGTHVAGIIGMSPNNGGGVGLAYGAKIMAIKAGQSTGSFASSDIAKAIKYAADNGADVINMSFGGSGKSYLIEEALKDAFHDCILVAAAGNDGLPTTDAPTPPYFLKEDFYPAGYNYVIGVMASDNNGNFADFSNWDYIIGSNCEYEMAAPGVSIYSTLPGNRYASWSGTSMAAPNVAAAAAILRSKYTDKNKYTSRFIMGQLVSATKDSSTFSDKHTSISYPLLNIEDSMTNLPKPRIKLNNFYMFDDSSIAADNNGDGIAQPGEVINLGFEAFNYWGTAKDVTITVDAISDGGVPNPHVEFITNSINMGEIGTFATYNNGFSYTDGALTGVTTPVTIRIKEGTSNDVQIKLNFTIIAKNGMDSNDTTTYESKGSYTVIVQNGYAISGVIDHDMTWTADKYWIIQNNVLIPEGVTVTVEPGTQIQFWSADPSNPYADMQLVFIEIRGEFIAEGTEEKPIEMFPGKGFEDKTVTISDISEKSSFKYVNCVNAASFYELPNWYYFKIANIDHCCFIIDFTNDGRFDDSISSKTIKNTLFKNYRNVNCGTTNNSPSRHIRAIEFDTCLFSDVSVSLSYQNDILINSVVLNQKMEDPNIVLYEYDCSKFQTVSNNAILSRYHTIPFERIRFACTSLKRDISGNFWGTTNRNIINKLCYDANLNVSYGLLDKEPFLTLDDDMSTIYPFVTEAYITDKNGNRIDTVNGKQNVSLHVKFNRDMAQDIQPQVTYGGSEPYTDYRPNGQWVGKREWRADFTIDPFIEMGRMWIRVKGAAADDDRWLVTGEDTERFFFEVSNTGAQAMKLHGSGTSGACDLDWVQDDYDTFAGYNIYRGTSYDSTKDVSQQSFTKLNTSILSDITFSDKNVEQGKDYYYYFTVIDTAMKESKPSNVVKCIPLDEEGPIITHTPVTVAAVGDQISVKATVEDNVNVSSVTLNYRNKGDKTWKNISMRNISGNTYSGIISAYEIAEGSLEYYISASDGTKNVSNQGTADKPLVITVSVAHKYDEGTVQKAATCTEAGVKVYKCLECSNVKTEEIPALGHSYSTEWTIDKEATCQNEGEKSHHCSRCEAKKDVTVMPIVDHVWDAGKVTKSNSCTEEGIKHFKCIYCSKEKDDNIPATGHKYKDTVHQATCTERGYTEHICQNCGESYKSDFTEIADHEFEETILNAATCTADGVKQLVCKNCKDKKTVAIPAIGHHFTDEVIEPTQDTLGYTIHKCGYSYIDTYKDYITSEPIERTPGDANDDGIVDLVDVILIRRYLAGGWDVDINTDNADVDGDEEVTLLDVILIRRYLAGGFDVILK